MSPFYCLWYPFSEREAPTSQTSHPAQPPSPPFTSLEGCSLTGSKSMFFSRMCDASSLHTYTLSLPHSQPCPFTHAPVPDKTLQQNRVFRHTAFLPHFVSPCYWKRPGHYHEEMARRHVKGQAATRGESNGSSTWEPLNCNGLALGVALPHYSHLRTMDEDQAS